MPGPLVPCEGDPALQRKLDIGSHIFDTWTLRGAQPAGLAHRFVDGSIDALEAFMASNSSGTSKAYGSSAQQTAQQQASNGTSEAFEPAAAQDTAQQQLSGALPAASSIAPVEEARVAGLAADARAANDAGNDRGKLSKQEPGAAPVCITASVSAGAGVADQAVEGPSGGLTADDGGPSTSGEEHASVAARLPRRHASELSYDEFVACYMAPNQPVIIQGCADDWRARRDWVTPAGGVDLDALERVFGDSYVWVTDTARQHVGCGPRIEMTVAEFCAWWRRKRRGEEPGCLYLKDWHFAAEYPDYKAYRLPHYFREDWLNDYYDMRAERNLRAEDRCPSEDCRTAADSCPVEECPEDQASQPGVSPEVATSDYRFVYAGPAGSWTPLHADVLRSFSWSTNVAGRKRWRLLPPQYTPLLFDRFGREMAADFSGGGLDPKEVQRRFPNLAAAAQHVVECIQEPGETIFVPSGWHHCVENLDDCISINHNWLNAHNLHWGWALLQRERAQAEAAIADCRALCDIDAEFESLVQRNLAANSGLDFGALAAFVSTIARRELAALQSLGLAGSSPIYQPVPGTNKEDSSTEITLARRELAGLGLERWSWTERPVPGVSQRGVRGAAVLQHALNLRRAEWVLRGILEGGCGKADSSGKGDGARTAGQSAPQASGQSGARDSGLLHDHSAVPASFSDQQPSADANAALSVSAGGHRPESRRAGDGPPLGALLGSEGAAAEVRELLESIGSALGALGI